MISTKRFDEIGKYDLALAGGKGALPPPAPRRSALDSSRLTAHEAFP